MSKQVHIMQVPVLALQHLTQETVEALREMDESSACSIAGGFMVFCGEDAGDVETEAKCCEDRGQPDLAAVIRWAGANGSNGSNGWLRLDEGGNVVAELDLYEDTQLAF